MWHGMMVASGSISRIIGPVIVVLSYKNFGTGWTFGAISIFMALPMVLLYYFRKRLIIEHPKDESVNMTAVSVDQIK
jgi:dipeptide/tripeptide permease